MDAFYETVIAQVYRKTLVRAVDTRLGSPCHLPSIRQASTFLALAAGF